MWFKNGKEKFYLDSYEVQQPSELIASHRYFTIVNEFNKTVKCFAVIYVFLHWSFLWEIIFKL